jgi:hypothetical protein
MTNPQHLFFRRQWEKAGSPLDIGSVIGAVFLKAAFEQGFARPFGQSEQPI